MTAPVKTYSHCTIHLQLETTVSSATLTLLSGPVTCRDLA